MLRHSPVCLVLMLVVVGSPWTLAEAGTVDATFTGVSPGKTVKTNIHSSRVWAGIYNWTRTDPLPVEDFWTICIEPDDWLDTTSTFEETTLEDVFSPRGNADARAALIRELFAGYVGTEAGQVDPTDKDDDLAAAAFQVAAWEFIMETVETGEEDPYSVSDGSFHLHIQYSSDAAVIVAANAMIDNVWNHSLGTATVTALQGAQSQGLRGEVGQEVVPLPAAVWCGMALFGGMGGISAVRRRLRRE